MPRTARSLKENAFYLITAESSEALKLFYDDQDYAAYMKLIKKYKRKMRVSVYGFCLMPNTIQMVIHVKQTRDLSRFMQRLHQVYTYYYNKRYRREGKLWRDRFKSLIISSYLNIIETIRILEFQPVIRRLSNSSFQYPWSSCIQRVMGSKSSIVDRLFIPEDNKLIPLMPADMLSWASLPYWQSLNNITRKIV